ncbi:MAG: thioredoxin family protein [Bacteroidia bacterium]|jgi:peroxiredoxin|nr:thioredoxin family protein [Bacteroidia bacterium]
MIQKSIQTILALCVLLNIAAAPANSPTGYVPDDQAIDFKLKNTDGKMISLASYPKAKGAIVVFTCNHCPFSQAYEQRIIELHKQFAPKGYPVIAINPNDKTRSPEDSYENMVIRAREKKYPFAYLYDESQEIAKTYGATRTPHVYLLQKKGNQFIVVYTGAIDDNSEEPEAVTEKFVSNAIQQLLASKPVTKATTKAIGCSIKWRK